jgi:hypothetical protein
MKRLALIAALLLAASPVAAQSVQQPLGTGGQINNSSLTNTGVICIEEMTATFCNVASGPNHSGYGSRGSVGSSAASGLSAGSGVSGPTGSAAPSAAIPTCPEFPPANELCN